jgi:uncharacterized repeat protein (TIGR03803 family)
MNKVNCLTKVCGALLLSAATVVPSPAQTFTTLHSFGNPSGGGNPAAPLVQATDGNLYGTAEYGGEYDGGAVFRITPSGGLTTLYKFCSESECTDGEYPAAGLLQAADGNLYGTTTSGGTQANGTVFKMTLRGSFTTLHSFDGTDGHFPEGALVQAGDGNLYGTTFGGGANAYGTVFKISSSGTLTVLYSFCSQAGCTDGSLPHAGLVQGTDGNLYGTTEEGGANGGHGTVFMITLSGTLTTLHSFCSQSGCPDGATPWGLIQATDGDFYATTQSGGENGRGTVFQITPAGTLTTLYSFCSLSACHDGGLPLAGLVQGTDGNFYGTTQVGGANGDGTVFEISSSGTFTLLHSYDGSDGIDTQAALIQDTDGNFFGATAFGGKKKAGTIFSLSVALDSFVEAQPTAARVGAAVKILGTNLTGASKVSFNGANAVFTVVSSSLISTTVPAGASSGTVHVITPDRNLESNAAFRVLP